MHKFKIETLQINDDYGRMAAIDVLLSSPGHSSRHFNHTITNIRLYRGFSLLASWMSFMMNFVPAQTRDNTDLPNIVAFPTERHEHE